MSATTTCTPSEATAVGRRSVVGVAWRFTVVGGEIGLSEHDRGVADTDRALAVIGQVVGGPRQHAGRILEQQYAMIAG